MSTEYKAEQNNDLVTNSSRRAWQAPELRRFEAGNAEGGPGASGETNSLS